tara:strand:- start:942 stop:1706 length:765 start_codon:yes stop_codon:yes gene_type:complete
MRIISTFNDSMYESTGEGMLKTVEKFLPEANIFIYEELNKNKLKYPSVKVADVPEFQEVYERHNKVIPPSFGGSAEVIHGEKFWNKRWFGWFRKVVMNYDAVCNQNFDDDYLVFVDSDIRFMKGFDDDFLKVAMKGGAIGFFRGNRPAIDSGLVVVDNKNPDVKLFYKRFMEVFQTGEVFTNWKRWDDGFVLTKIFESWPEAIGTDFADGCQHGKYRNTNGHKTVKQIIPMTLWRDYVEHDKGIHIRKGIGKKS